MKLKKASPAITRFVPGREGLGLTDRIDSVVDFMKQKNILVFDQNYGLWYDRRRDAHERVRRRDGDVWGCLLYTSSAPVLIRSTRKAGKIKVKARVQFEGTQAPVSYTHLR